MPPDFYTDYHSKTIHLSLNCSLIVHNLYRKLEWKRLGFYGGTQKERLQFLEDFCRKPIEIFIQDGLNCKHQGIWQDQLLLLQCLYISLEDEGHEKKFFPFIHFLEDGPFSQSFLHHQFQDSLLIKIIRQDNAELLQDVLEHYSSKPEVYKLYLQHMKINSPVLKMACKKGDYDMIKILVRNGCRLKISQRPKERLEQLRILHRRYKLLTCYFLIQIYTAISTRTSVHLSEKFLAP